MHHTSSDTTRRLPGHIGKTPGLTGTLVGLTNSQLLPSWILHVSSIKFNRIVSCALLAQFSLNNIHKGGNTLFILRCSFSSSSFLLLSSLSFIITHHSSPVRRRPLSIVVRRLLFVSPCFSNPQRGVRHLVWCILLPYAHMLDTAGLGAVQPGSPSTFWGSSCQ